MNSFICSSFYESANHYGAVLPEGKITFFIVFIDYKMISQSETTGVW